MKRIMAAMEGLDDDPVLLIGALGAVVGCIATAAPDPKACIANVIRMAEGVINGELLEPA